MPIQQPTAIVNTNNRYCVLIAGFPGIGKTTLGLSAPDPLHIDVDDGIRRVRAVHRRPFIHPASYDELCGDLKPENLTDYQTLVFDTGGALMSLLSRWAIEKDGKNGKRNGALTLQGYGVVGKEFARFIEYCRTQLRKHIVVIFHAKEDRDGDDTKLRIMVEGQTKDNIWQPMDVGGFIEIVNGKRVFGVTNCERYFAKGSYGVHGALTIPELDAGGTTPNDFLTKLFAKMDETLAAEAVQAAEENAKYEAVMATVTKIIAGIKTPEQANAALEKMKGIEHALTSYREAQNMFKTKIGELGFIRGEKGFEKPNEGGEEDLPFDFPPEEPAGPETETEGGAA